MFRMVLLWVSVASAQAPPPEIPKDPLLHLYNSRLDAAGQNVEKAAGAIANGAIFETQLENLKLVSQREMERIFASQRRAALARIEGARRWSGMQALLAQAKERALSAEEASEWQARRRELETQLAAIPQPGAAQPNAETATEIGRAQEFLQAARFLAEKGVGSQNDLRFIKRLQEGLASIGQNLAALAAMPVAPSSRSAQQRMKIALIQAEMDYWRNIGLIEARRQAGQKEAQDLFTQLENTLECSASGCALKFENADGETTREALPATEEIDKTLTRYQAEPEKLKAIVFLLENFAAIAARAETPIRIAEWRMAVEERRFDIRKDAIFARSYEEIFLLGAQRLALYGKGGIKPEALAGFLQAAMTAGLIPAVSLR
jgi:hypothetical protein